MSEEAKKPRKLTSHIVNPCNDKLDIEVLDEPGSGGASHLYGIYGFHSATNKAAPSEGRDETCTKILFQNGPIPEVGTNGVTHEALLAIVEDRLKSFQAGPFACRENAIALTHLQECQNWLNRRTIERMRRNVEGTHAV